MFKDKEVDNKVKYRLGIFDDKEPSEEDLEKVTDIFISNLNAKGEQINTDISEIVKLSELRDLDLKGFNIDSSLINIINSLPELDSLKLYACESSRPLSITLEKLKVMILDRCKSINLSGAILPENVIIVNGEMVDISKFTNTKKLTNLEIKNSEIINSSLLSEIKGLKRANFDGSTLDDDEVIKLLRSKKIAVSNELEYHPIK